MSRYFPFPRRRANAGAGALLNKARPTASLRLGLASTLLAMAFAVSSAAAAMPGRTVVIGPLEWAAANLDVGTFSNGDPIPEARTPADWVQAARDGTPAWAWYDGDPRHGARHGRLYNFAAVEDPRGLAPPGWRVATARDFAELIRAAGPDAAPKLKSTSGWSTEGNGSNASGYNARPAGARYGNGRSYGRGEYAVLGSADGGRFFLTALGSFRGSGNFGRDGLRWDSGWYLNRGEGVAFPGSDAYSGNTVVGHYDPTARKRLLIQASISYDASRTNVKH